MRKHSSSCVAGFLRGAFADETGSLSLITALVIPAVVVASVSFAGLLLAGEKWLSTAAAAREARGKALSVVEKALVLLKSDPSPGAHSHHDPFWRHSWTSVEVSEISSAAVGPPHGHTGFHGGVRQDRSRGAYDFVNVNVASRERILSAAAARLAPHVSPRLALRRVFRARAAGESFTEDSLRLALGEYYRALHPVLTARPAINVNTASKERLSASLALGGYLGDRTAAVTRLVAVRREKEIGEAEMRELLRDLDVEKPALHLLGVRSQGVSLLIERDRRRYHAVILWVPSREVAVRGEEQRGEQRGEYRLVRFAEVEQ